MSPLPNQSLILVGIAAIACLQMILLFWFLRSQLLQRSQASTHYDKIQQALTTQLHQLHVDLQHINQTSQHTIHEKISQGQLISQQLITDTMQRQMGDVREQM